MKKAICIILLAICTNLLYGHNYTSVGAGGNWSAPASTWTGGPVGTVEVLTLQILQAQL